MIQTRKSTYKYSLEYLCLFLFFFNLAAFVSAQEKKYNSLNSLRSAEKKTEAIKNDEADTAKIKIPLSSESSANISHTKNQNIWGKSLLKETFVSPKKFRRTEDELKKPDSSETDGEADQSNSSRQDKQTRRWEIPRGSTEYGVELGYAPRFATWMSGPKYFDIRGKKHLLASFRWGKIYANKRFVTFSWAVEFIPLSLAIGNEVDNPKAAPGNGQPPTIRENTYGVAINPASFRFIFFPKWRLRPQLGAGFGVSRHWKRVPTIDGTKGYAQIDFQIGGQYMLSEKKALNFGYRYFHLSNIYLAKRNPGYNMNMFFIGYSIFK